MLRAEQGLCDWWPSSQRAADYHTPDGVNAVQRLPTIGPATSSSSRWVFLAPPFCVHLEGGRAGVCPLVVG
jgi:hypothetical protein